MSKELIFSTEELQEFEALEIHGGLENGVQNVQQQCINSTSGCGAGATQISCENTVAGCGSGLGPGTFATCTLHPYSNCGVQGSCNNPVPQTLCIG